MSAERPDQTPNQRYSHDIPLSELDGQHAKSIDCPCGPDVEQVTPRAAIVYHQRVGGALVEDDGTDRSCTWCGGDGFDECDDPIQCCDPACDGEMCRCTACDGRGYDQVVW